MLPILKMTRISSVQLPLIWGNSFTGMDLVMLHVQYICLCIALGSHVSSPKSLQQPGVVSSSRMNASLPRTPPALADLVPDMANLLL
jgi:hypothetical protein